MSNVSKEDRIKEIEKELESLRGELTTERNSLVAQAEDLLHKAEALTDKIGDEFSWDVAYGMGGLYDGKRGEWTSSSESC